MGLVENTVVSHLDVTRSRGNRVMYCTLRIGGRVAVKDAMKRAAIELDGKSRGKRKHVSGIGLASH